MVLLCASAGSDFKLAFHGVGQGAAAVFAAAAAALATNAKLVATPRARGA
jgi:hypothetical protein